MTTWRSVVPVFVIFIHIHTVEGSTYKIERNPTAPVKPGRTVSFTCSIRKNVNPSMALMWVKKVGRLEYNIGRNQIIVAPFNRAMRYSATGMQLRSDHYISVLTIKDVTEEDIGEIGCVVQGSTSTIYSTLAVCENPDSESCKCIQTTGWAKPSCWEDPPTLQQAQAEFRRIIIGLAVCLAIVVIFGVIMMAVVGRDIMARFSAKRAGNRPMVNQEEQQNTNPYAQSEQVTADIEELEFVSGSAVEKSTDPYAYRRNDSLRGKNKNVTPSNHQRPTGENGGARSNTQPLSVPMNTYDSRYSPQTPKSHLEGGMGVRNSPSTSARGAGLDDGNNYDDYNQGYGGAYVSQSGANV